MINITRYFAPPLGLLLLFLVGAALTLYAEPAPGTAVSVRFVCGEPVITGLSLRTIDKDREEVSVEPYRAGAAVLLPVGRPVVLEREVMRDGKPTHEPVVQFTLPNDVRQVLVALIRRPDAKPNTYDALVIPEDPEVFSKGKILAINLTAYPCRVKTGEQTDTLTAFEWKLLTPQLDRLGRTWQFVALEAGGQWHLAGRQALAIPAEYRALLFVTISRTLGLPAPDAAPRPATFTAVEWIPPQK